MKSEKYLEFQNDRETTEILFNATIGDLRNQNRHRAAEEMEKIRDRVLDGLDRLREIEEMNYERQRKFDNLLKQ